MGDAGVVFRAASDRVCLSLDSKRWVPKPLVAAFVDPPVAVRLVANEKTSDSCEQGDLLWSGYRVRPASRGADEAPAVGIAVTGGPYRVRTSRQTIRLFSKNDQITLRRCASDEGLHLTAWRGKKRIWHEYYYLGYAVESTCSEPEWRD